MSSAGDDAAAVTTASLAVDAETGVAVIRIDDGKVNAFTLEMIEAVRDAVRGAAAEASAIVVLGRPGSFSAGLDRHAMTAGPDAMVALFESGLRLVLEVLSTRIPVVFGCTGHAIGSAAVFLLSADLRIGGDGPFSIGTIEVANGAVPTPVDLVLARHRLAPNHLTGAVLLARRFSPAEAVDVGFLDEIVAAEDVERVAVQRAAELAALPASSFGATKRLLRGPIVVEAQAALDDALRQLRGAN